MKHHLQKKAARLDRLAESVRHLPMFHMDADLGILARNLVHETLAEILEFETQETRWSSGELIPIDSRISEGATEYGYTELEKVGEAKIVADNATDIPEATIQGAYNTHQIKTVACKFSYSTQELRSAQMMGTALNVVEEKSAAAREGHDIALNRFIRDGVPLLGLAGATNAPGTIYQTAATSGLATSATSAEIVAVVTTAINTINNESDGLERADTVVFPIDVFNRIKTLKNSDSSDITVLQYLRNAFPEIMNWVADVGMNDADIGGGPAILAYRKDARRIRAVMPMMLVALPPQEHGLTFEVILESRFGGVMVPRPRSVLLLGGIG